MTAPSNPIFPANINRFDPYKTYRFLVYFGTSTTPVAAVSKVSGLKRSSDVIEYKEAGNAVILKGLGRTKYEPVTLERGVTQNTDFETWANAAQVLDQGAASTSLANLRREITHHLAERGGATGPALDPAPVLGFGVPGDPGPRRRRQRRGHRAHQARERGVGARPDPGRADGDVVDAADRWRGDRRAGAGGRRRAVPARDPAHIRRRIGRARRTGGDHRRPSARLGPGGCRPARRRCARHSARLDRGPHNQRGAMPGTGLHRAGRRQLQQRHLPGTPPPPRPRNVSASDDGWYRLAGSTVRFRIPNVTDLLAAGESTEPAAVLASRCLEPASLPTRTARAVDRALAAMAPSLEGLVGGNCPECGAEVALRFDPLTYTMLELRDTFAGIYRETHALASAYGWPEETILRQPRSRRQRYAAMVFEDHSYGACPAGSRTVRPAKSAVPAYLSRLAGGAPAVAPRLQPPRPLFPPAAGALTDAEPEPPVAGFDGHAGPVQPDAGLSHHRGPVTTSSGTDIAAGPVGYQASQRLSHAQAANGEALDPLPALPAQPIRGGMPPSPGGSARRPDRGHHELGPGSDPGRKRRAGCHPCADDVSSTPGWCPRAAPAEARLERPRDQRLLRPSADPPQ